MFNYSEIEEMVLPCNYTVAEAEQRIIQSTADVDENRDCVTNTEFRKIAKSWLKWNGPH